MTKVYKRVAKILAEGNQYPEDKVEKYCKAIFKRSIKKREIAELFLQEANPINQKIINYITFPAIKEFLLAHYDLKDQLIAYYPLTPAQEIEVSFQVFSEADKEARAEECKRLFALAFEDEAAASLFVSEINIVNKLLVLAVKDKTITSFARLYPNLQDDLRQFIPQHRSRTAQAILAHEKSLVENVQKHEGISYACVTRETRDFNTCLVSLGSATREKILLNPKDKKLKNAYAYLKYHLDKEKKPKDILSIFAVVAEIAKGILQKGKYIPLPDTFVPLSDFIDKGQGVCRHHALLAAYFLSRLKEDKILEGNIIVHRRSLYNPRSAHSWVLFQSSAGEWYSLDTFRRAPSIYLITKENVMNTYGYLTWVGIDEIYLNSFSNLIKEYIGIKEFSCPRSFFRKSEIIYQDKEVPTRIAKLYKLCCTVPNEKQLQALAVSWLLKSSEEAETSFYKVVKDLDIEGLKDLIAAEKEKRSPQIDQFVHEYVANMG